MSIDDFYDDDEIKEPIRKKHKKQYSDGYDDGFRSGYATAAAKYCTDGSWRKEFHKRFPETDIHGDDE